MSLAPLAQPTNDEQYMLELVNRARANPQAEAQRLVQLAQTDPTIHAAVGSWNLNTFAQVLSSMPAEPPLAFNTRLIAAARAQDQTMLAANNQTHSGSDYLVSTPAPDGQPYYPVSSSGWATGENVFAYSRNVPSGSSVQQYLDFLYAGLMIDWNNPDFGHLKNIMNVGPSQGLAQGKLPYSEVGIGVLENANPSAPPPANPSIAANKGLNVGPVIVSQEFGWRNGNAFLTGTFYQDDNSDNFYTPGEGIGGVTVSASGLEGQGTYTTQTWASGGYSLALPPGSYVVTASGNLSAPRSTTISIGVDNVGWSVQVPGGPPADIAVPGDYDGDGKTDLAVFRPDTATWIITLSSGGSIVKQFGWGNHDVPVPADYDGDGKTDLAVFRPDTATWYVQLSSGGSIVTQFGQPNNDVPVPGDYDGDGKADLAVFRPDSATWFVRKSSGGSMSQQFGWGGHDIPIPGDYDGDGKADFAVFRPDTATWFVLNSSGGSTSQQFGWAKHDVPVPGNYDGDGKTEIAVYRPDTGEWFVSGSRAGSQYQTLGGVNPSNTPVEGDFDGDGKTDMGVIRTSDMTWFQLQSSAGLKVFQYGRGGADRSVGSLLKPTLANRVVRTAAVAEAQSTGVASIPPPPQSIAIAKRPIRRAHPLPPRVAPNFAQKLAARRAAVRETRAYRHV